jgi:hypothetical protein
MTSKLGRPVIVAAVVFVCLMSTRTGDVHADAESWPIEIMNRPLTLPEASFSAGLAVGANRDLSVIDGAATGLWGLSYGVTDALSLGVGYSLLLHELESRGPLDLIAGYTYYAGGPLTLAATAGYSHDFASGGDSVSAGTLVWMMLGERFALISPGSQFAVGLEDGATTLSLPVAVGVQASPRVFAQVGVELATIGIAEADTTLFIDDQATIEATGFFSPTRQIDLGASISADPVAGISDSLAFGLVVLIYGGV